MISKELQGIVKEVSKEFAYDPAALASVIQVESGGKGFDSTTGKILIQFEPAWMKRLAPYTPSGKWSVNKVDVQSKEWIAFNDAFAKDKEAAMKATSIGLPQIMGFHYDKLGFKTVGEMWDFAKASLKNQVRLLALFIKANPNLLKAFKAKNWDGVATIYNGSGYKALAKKLGREPYDISMKKAYGVYDKLFN